MNRAILIFAKNLIYGEVKTRLAATVGNDSAFIIYKELLMHTQVITKDLVADKIVFYSNRIEENDIWGNEIYKKQIQKGDNLGERMQNAFAYAFENEYEEAVIIGTDCFELTSSIINEAFSNLKYTDIVIGPAEDGGYYLLGMKSLYPGLFQKISWSTKHVFQQTLAICRKQNLTYYLLQKLSDIDDEKGFIKNKTSGNQCMISIIIPTYNEANQIAETILKTKAANENFSIEIIIVDGGSTDETISIAGSLGAITILSGKKGRAAQMNKGATMASGEILYFLHADSIPPKKFTTYIMEAVDKGFSNGCFRLCFDYSHWFLKASSWFTRFNVNAIRFGDQSLFVTKDAFHKSGGFNESLLMMEDQEIIHRLKKQGKFIVMNEAVTTSARKYIDNGIYRTQAIFFRIWFLYYIGYSQERLLKLHRKLIRKYKL